MNRRDVLRASLLAAPLLLATMAVAPVPFAAAEYGELGFHRKATTRTSTSSSVGDERQIPSLCVPFFSDGSRHLRVTVSVRLMATGAPATGDIRIRRDPNNTVCSGTFDYDGAIPAGGASAYMPLIGGAGAESVVAVSEEVPPAGQWVYRATVTKTAGSPTAVLWTNQTSGGDQFLLVEDIGSIFPS